MSLHKRVGSYTASTTQVLLREDDNLLRQTFFSILKHHNAPMAHKVDIVYALAQAWCYSESERDFEMLEARIKDLQPHEMILVRDEGVSTCALVLSTAGQRIQPHAQPAQPERGNRHGDGRESRSHGRGALWLFGLCFPSTSHATSLDNDNQLLSNTNHCETISSQVEASTRSTNRSFKKLVMQDGIDPKLIYDTICKQTVELTFTAHPTQALRMSLLKKYSNVRTEVQRLHGSRMSPYEKMECLDAIRSHVQVGLWCLCEVDASHTPKHHLKNTTRKNTGCMANGRDPPPKANPAGRNAPGLGLLSRNHLQGPPHLSAPHRHLAQQHRAAHAAAGRNALSIWQLDGRRS